MLTDHLNITGIFLPTSRYERLRDQWHYDWAPIWSLQSSIAFFLLLKKNSLCVEECKVSVFQQKNCSHGKSELNYRISQPRRMLKEPLFLVMDQEGAWNLDFGGAIEKFFLMESIEFGFSSWLFFNLIITTNNYWEPWNVLTLTCVYQTKSKVRERHAKLVQFWVYYLPDSSL